MSDHSQHDNQLDAKTSDATSNLANKETLTTPESGDGSTIAQPYNGVLTSDSGDGTGGRPGTDPGPDLTQTGSEPDPPSRDDDPPRGDDDPPQGDDNPPQDPPDDEPPPDPA